MLDFQPPREGTALNDSPINSGIPHYSTSASPTRPRSSAFFAASPFNQRRRRLARSLGDDDVADADNDGDPETGEDEGETRTGTATGDYVDICHLQTMAINELLRTTI